MLDALRQGRPAGDVDLAGENYERRVEHDADRCEPERDPARQLVEQRTAGAADLHGRRDGGCSGRALEAVFAGDHSDALGADELLEPALGPVRRIAMYLAAGHRDPAGLAGGAAVAAEQPPADHDAQTDTSTDPQQHEVIDALRRAGMRLGHRHEVDVVLEAHRAIEVVAQLREQAALPPRQVEREREVAGVRIDETRCAEHDAVYVGEWSVRLFGGGHHGAVYDANRIIGVLRRQFDATVHRAGDVRAGRHDV